MLKKAVFIFIFLNFIFLGFSVHYADLDIFVDESGKTTITGFTNYDSLIVTDSHKFTSKNGEMWVFNLSVDENFSEFIFNLNLPTGANTNYIKTTPNFRISQGDDDNLKIIGIGEKRKLQILVQYSFEELEESNFEFLGFYFSYIVLGLVVLGIIITVIFKKLKNSHIAEEIISEVEELEEKIIGIDYSKLNLNERQLEIIQILKKYEEISQKSLEGELNIPKSSVSRNLQSLSAKKIISIKKSGITNLISLIK
jgi:uncharacterized membrane protein